MTPKITNEMRDALHQNHGRPVEVEDDQSSGIYVLIDKTTFAHLQETQGHADDETRQHLQLLIKEGVASGNYEPADAVFAGLRQYAEGLESKRDT